MSSIHNKHSEDEVNFNLNYKELALPVDEAVKLAFMVSPTQGAIILGPPGIGKTELVYQYAKREAEALEKKFVDFNEAQGMMSKEEFEELLRDILRNPEKYYVFVRISLGAVRPEELREVLRIVTILDSERVLSRVERSALMNALMVLMVRGIHGVLLIDDIHYADDDVSKAFLLTVFKYRHADGFIGFKPSPNVRVIAVGTTTSEGKLPTPLPRSMVGCALVMRVRPPSLNRWYSYMEAKYGDRWFREVYAFLKRYPQFFAKPELYKDELSVWPMPVAWTNLALVLMDFRDEIPEMLRSEKGIDILTKIVAGLVGYEAATHFVAFLKKPVVSVEEVLGDPSKINDLVGDMDRVFRFALQLGERIRDALRSEDAEKLIEYLRVLHDLMTRTTRDVSEFVYSMLTPEERVVFKRMLENMMKSDKPKVREIASELYRDLQ